MKTQPEINEFPDEIILWGGTGQSKVVRAIVEHYGSKVVAVFDDTPELKAPFSDIPLYCGKEGFLKWMEDKPKNRIGFCVAIGNPHGRVRLKLHDELESAGLLPITLAHPTAWIAKNARIGVGSQILAGAVVGVEAVLGRQCIINTNASVDHEDVLEDGVEIAPGATLCGSVHLKTNVWIGAGAVILPRVVIGQDTVVGAGAVVLKDLPEKSMFVGVPAIRKIR